MASGVFNRGKARLCGSLDWGSTSIGVLLVTSSYTPNVDHNTVSQITNELSGGGYARVTTVGSRSVVQDDTANAAELVAAKTVFTSLGAAAGTPQYAIVYDNTNGADASRDVLFWIDLGTPATPDGNNYEIRWNGVDGTGEVMSLS